MPIRLKPGIKKKSPRGEYEIVSHMNDGMFATAYEAKTASGRKVFFKEYKSPTPTVAWFNGYVAYQQELKRRIESDPATRSRCYEFLDFFVDRFFYQVFQFIEGGESLEGFLERTQVDLNLHWDERVEYSRTMMYAMAGLHKAAVVHCDLKPDNLYLLPHPSIPGKRWLRVIDMDFAVLADVQAPWHGINGYVGTPSYQSPEHLAGKVPGRESDVFTLGLILGELLVGKHPFSGIEDYEPAAMKGGLHNRIKVAQPIKNVLNHEFLEDVLNACLNPNPGNRPTAQQVAEALMGKEFDFPDAWRGKRRKASVVDTMTDEKPKSNPKPKLATKPIDTEMPLSAESNVHRNAAVPIELWFDGKCVTRVSTNAEIGKYTFKGVHDDYKYLNSSQFHLFRAPGSRVWMISTSPDATNETMLNGKALREPCELKDGMRISVGNSAKEIEKLPLTVKIGS